MHFTGVLIGVVGVVGVVGIFDKDANVAQLIKHLVRAVAMVHTVLKPIGEP